jgi:hypothetical protein
LLLAQAIEIVLRLIPTNLVLERLDALLPLQIVDLLPLAYRIPLPLDSLDPLIVLQPLELLLVFELVELALRVRGVGLLRLCGFAFLLLDPVKLPLLLIEVLIAP